MQGKISEKSVQNFINNIEFQGDLASLLPNPEATRFETEVLHFIDTVIIFRDSDLNFRKVCFRGYVCVV